MARDPLLKDVKIVVPEGMLKYVTSEIGIKPGYEDYATEHVKFAKIALEAALRWLSENPIVPTLEEAEELHSKWHYDGVGRKSYAIEFQRMCYAWERRMFVAPEPEVPEVLEGMMFSAYDIELHLKNPNAKQLSEHLNSYIIEAYRCGLQETGSK